MGFLIALVITWRQVFISVANRKKYPNVVDAVVPYVPEHRTNTQVVLVVHRRAFSLLAFAFRLLVGWNYEGGARVLFAPLTHLVGGQQIEGDNEQQASNPSKCNRPPCHVLSHFYSHSCASLKREAGLAA